LAPPGTRPLPHSSSSSSLPSDSSDSEDSPLSILDSESLVLVPLPLADVLPLTVPELVPEAAPLPPEWLPDTEPELVPEAAPLPPEWLPDTEPEPDAVLKSEEEAGEPTELGKEETENGLAEVVLTSDESALDGCEEPLLG